MYTVYKIINNINEKYYIGVHKTANPNDTYFGSGRAIKDAIKMYGKHNFKKEILFITNDKKEAFLKEQELTKNYTDRNNYNMKLGGVGGFTKEAARKGYEKSLKIINPKTGGLAAAAKGYAFGGYNQKCPVESGRKGGMKNKGKKLTEAHKQAIRNYWIRKKLASSNG